MVCHAVIMADIGDQRGEEGRSPRLQSDPVIGARIVDQAVDTVPRRDDLRDCGGTGGVVGHFGADEDRRGLEHTDGRLERGIERTAPEDGGDRPLLRQQRRDRATDPCATARDDDDFTVESQLHDTPSSIGVRP